MPSEDGAWIQRIRAHDLSAFDALFGKYQNAVYRFASYLTQNRAEADDLFQEAWLRAVRYLPTSPEIRDFKAWMLTIVVNLHRDALRKKKLWRLFSLPWSKSDTDSDAILENLDYQSHALAADESERVDLGIALDHAIAALPIKLRRIFLLKEIEGLKHVEISAMLGLPVGTVKSLLHQAIRNLRQHLSEFRYK